MCLLMAEKYRAGAPPLLLFALVCAMLFGCGARSGLEDDVGSAVATDDAGAEPTWRCELGLSEPDCGESGECEYLRPGACGLDRPVQQGCYPRLPCSPATCVGGVCGERELFIQPLGLCAVEMVCIREP